MGQTGFCKNQRFSAKICGFLRESPPPKINAVIPRKSENLQKSVKICENLRIWLRLSLLVCPFQFPLIIFLWTMAFWGLPLFLTARGLRMLLVRGLAVRGERWTSSPHPAWKTDLQKGLKPWLQGGASGSWRLGSVQSWNLNKCLDENLLLWLYHPATDRPAFPVKPPS